MPTEYGLHVCGIHDSALTDMRRAAQVHSSNELSRLAANFGDIGERYLVGRNDCGRV